MQVGFVGLGKMGSGMARSLLRAGAEVVAWNRSPEPAEQLVKEGARWSNDIVEVFQAEAVVTMLPTDASIRETIFDNRVLRQARSDMLHIVCSTISVAFAETLERAHKAHGVAFVSAPVLGRPDVADAGELNVLLAGEPTAVGRATPIVEMFAKKVWRIGERPSAANVAKLASNFALACAIEAMAEASALARRYEISPATLMEIFTGTAFSAPAYKVYGPVVAKQSFEPAGFLLRHGLKDVRQVIEAGETVGAPLPFAGILRDNFIDAVAHGDADKDWSALSAVAMRRAGL